MNKRFDNQVRKLADVAVKVGVNVQPGQRLLIRGAHLEAAPLVRAITEAAYTAGALYVDVHWEDGELDKIRHRHAPRESFEYYPQWKADAYNHSAQTQDAILAITGDDPDNLVGCDPELINLERKVKESMIQDFRAVQMKNNLNWSIVSWPVTKWAEKLFPNMHADESRQQLWDAIFHTSRLHHDDPVAHWREHADNLKQRAAYMNEKQYRYLEYTGPGTDLRIGLPPGHIWCAAESETPSGIRFVANIPTEEIFTVPHKDETEGVVACSKPLNYQGTVIEDFSLTFERGKVVAVQAAKGQDVLEHLLATDDGARMLGEVALVPHDSPIAQSDVLFYNTLFDENAASHLALGSAYPFCLAGGTDMSDEDFARAGGNKSLAHVDFMIGSDRLAIDGILPDGTRESVMRDGVWSFDI